MALKFRLKGLAETFIDAISCPGCGASGHDDENFSTEFSKVTYEGIVVVAQCRTCSEIFVPTAQRLGVISPQRLKDAVKKDAEETGEKILSDLTAVKLAAERLNAQRKGDIH
jgi:hypothetical protein